MQPVVHFIISIGIAFALEINYSKKYSMILLFGFVGMLPDLDHLLPFHNGVGIFHNPVVLGVIPLVLLMVAMMIENANNKDSSKYSRLFISVTVILLGHLMLDLIAGSAISLNVFSENGIFHVDTLPLLTSANLGVLLDLSDIVWLILGVMVLLGNIAQRQIYANMEDLEEYREIPVHKPVSNEDALRAIVSSPVYAQKFRSLRDI